MELDKLSKESPIKQYVGRLGELTHVLEHAEIKRQEIVNMMSQSPAICFVKDADTGVYIYVNRAFTEIYGLPETAILGRNNCELCRLDIDHTRNCEVCDTDMAQALTSNDREVLQTKVAKNYVEQLGRCGQERTFLISKFIIRNGSESIGGIGIEIPALARSA